MLKQLSNPTCQIRLWSGLWIVMLGLAIASCSFRISSNASDNRTSNDTPETDSAKSTPSALINVPAVADSTPPATPPTVPDEALDKTDEAPVISSVPTESNPKKSNPQNTAEPESPATSDIIEGTVGFVLPSGNIYCLTYDQILRCEMKSLLNPMPPQPDTCDLDWGGGVILPIEGPTEVLCAGDTIAGNYDTLAYGTTWRTSGFECMSETVGLTCKNINAQGFFLSRERWDIF